MNTNDLHVDPTLMPYDSGISKDWHRHVCPNPECKFEWSHNGAEMFFSTYHEFEDAHHCPKCGAEQTWCAPVRKGKRKAS